MPLLFVKDDIITMTVDAIVNAANNTLLGGGGVDGCIHRAAGAQLLAECRTLGGCDTGDAKLTKGYDLPCKYVIHTVGPVWRGGDHDEEYQLRSCYRRSLAIAAEQACETVAFPLISAGVYGYPKEQAFRIAVGEIAAFLSGHEMTVYLVVFDDAVSDEIRKTYTDVARFAEERYERHIPQQARGASRLCGYGMSDSAPCADEEERCEALSFEVDESFSQMLLRKIDERGMTDAQCYKKANIDRKLFSKIRSDVHYRPGKPTAVAFAIALELSLDETKELLCKAGYALSHSFRFDLIIEYCLVHHIYDIHTVNEILFAYDQPLLGVSV